jgi:PTH1 family peptidyl-tRNA hydrolase
MKYLITDLGNPGPKYELTRHNIGFLTLDRLADREGAGNWTTGRHADITELKYKGRSLYLIKPITFMNLSGKAVNYWLQELKIPKENLLVITDDLSLPYGKLRMRGKGSAGGHNGLKDIEKVLGGQEYARLRMGIGDDFHKGQQVDYVLSNFSKQEMDNMLPLLDTASDMILAFATLGLEKAMNQFNK